MNRLLQRQIRKHLLENGVELDEQLQVFLDAVSSSYTNYEEQLTMVQRAMSLSSDELFEANKKLQKETSQQKNIIESLTQTIAALYKYNNQLETPKKDSINLDALELARVIDNQTREIIATNKHRDELLAQLEKQNEELNDYAHIVSHDLKSPLNNINALTNFIIEDDRLSEESIENLDLILEHVEHMHNLIQGILEYSAIDKAVDDKHAIDLNRLVTDLLATMHTPKHIEISVLKHLPKVYGNSFRFQQLFQNLIQNAINYNDKAQGVVRVTFEERDECYEFSIADNGRGIDPAYHDKIFQVFQTLEQDAKHKGIGLSIVLKIIKFYGGKIWLSSKPKEGTTFYFTLPKH